MTNISDLEIQNNEISWKLDGKRITVPTKQATQVLADNERALVFSLSSYNDEKFLSVHSFSGELEAKLVQPKAFNFSFLTNHPEVGVAVVAGSNEKVEGWYDWHFKYDKSKKSISRHCPAY